MYNKKILLEAIKNLEKAKAPARKKDITFDPTGKGMLNPIYAGKPVVLPTDTLYNPTPYPIKATSDNGIQKFLNPFDETNVHFPGASSIKEEPLMKKGGSKKQSKSLSATNKLLKKNPLFKKKNYKGKTYDPSAMYFQDGGFIPYDYNPYVSAEAPMEDIPFVNPIITGTEPEDYQAFLDYSRTAPENRRPNENYFYGDPDNYDHYGMWEALGKPRNFQEALDMNPDWEPDPYDKMYHGFSVNPETGVFLKSGKPGDTKEGDTTWMEIAGHYLSPRANESTPVFDPELQRFKYIPNPSFQKGGQMSKEEFEKRKAAYKKLTGRDFEPPKTFKPSEKARQQYQEKYNQQPVVQTQSAETVNQSRGTNNANIKQELDKSTREEIEERNRQRIEENRTYFEADTRSNAQRERDQAAAKQLTDPDWKQQIVNAVQAPLFQAGNFWDYVSGGDDWKKAQEAYNLNQLNPYSQNKFSNFVSTGLSNTGNAFMTGMEIADGYALARAIPGFQSQAGKYLTQGPLKNAYKINPLANRTPYGGRIHSNFGSEEAHWLTGYPSKETIHARMMESRPIQLPVPAEPSNFSFINKKGNLFSPYETSPLKGKLKMSSSENVLSKQNFWNKSEIDTYIKQQQTKNKMWDDLYKEYESIDPTGKKTPDELNDLFPHLKEKFEAVKNYSSINLDEKFLTADLKKYLGKNLNQYINNTGNTRNPLNRGHLLDLVGTLNATDFLHLNLYPSSINIGNKTLKFPNQQFLINTWEKGRLNQYGGIVTPPAMLGIASQYQKGGAKMSPEEFEKRKAAYKKMTGRDFEPPKSFKPTQQSREYYQNKANQQPVVKSQPSETINQSRGVDTRREKEIVEAQANTDAKAAENYMHFYNKTYGSDYGAISYEQALQKVRLPDFDKTKYLNMYNLGQPKNEQLQSFREEDQANRTWEVITNPFTAFEYAVATGDMANMPSNINAARMQGYDVGVTPGRNMVGNTLNMTTNLFDAGDKVIRNVGEGNYLGAGLEAMRFLPGARFHTGLGKQTGKYLTQGPLRNAYKYNPRALKEKDVDFLYRWDPDKAYVGNKANDPVLRKYEGRWVHKNNPEHLWPYLEIRPGSGTVSSIAVPKGLADLPSDALPYVGGPQSSLKDLANLMKGEGIIPKSYMDKLNKFRIENNPMSDKSVDFWIESPHVKSAVEILRSSKPKPHWWRGYGSNTPRQLPGSPNVAPIVNTTPTPWSIQELPGLHLKSTMSDGATSKIVEPKTGMINVEQALGIIGKESGGADKVALIKQGLGNNIPKKMDYNEFRKLVQEQLIPLERQFVTHSSDYGIERLGYGDVNFNTSRSGNKTIHMLESDIIENQTLILSNKGKFGRGSSAHGNPDETLGHIHFLRDAETPDVLTVTQIQSDAFQGTHRIMPKTFDKEKELRSLAGMERIAKRQFDIKKTAKQLDDNTWEFPDGFKMDKSVFENIGTGQAKINAMKKAEIENFTQKQLLDKNHQERYLQELVDYAGKRGDVNKIRVPTSDTAAKVQGYRPVSELNKSEEFIKLRTDIVDALEKYGNNSMQYKKANEVYEQAVKNSKHSYSSEHQTILKKYAEQPKIIKKLFGVEPKVVKDSKGNTWYEFNIPEKFKKGKGEIKAFNWAIPATIATGAAASQYKQGGSIQSLDYFDTELTDEEIKQYLQGGEYLKLQQGGTPSEIWKQHTGTSWSEAKRQGLTDGSAAQNIALANRVLAGEFGESQVSYEDYQNSRAAYDQMVVDKVMRGATLDDLVTQRVGTRSGLINRFPDLFNQQSPQQPKTLPDKPSAKKENIQRNSPASVKETPVITRPVVKPQQQTPLNINELREKIKELKRKNQTQGPTALLRQYMKDPLKYAKELEALKNFNQVPKQSLHPSLYLDQSTFTPPSAMLSKGSPEVPSLSRKKDQQPIAGGIGSKISNTGTPGFINQDLLRFTEDERQRHEEEAKGRIPYKEPSFVDGIFKAVGQAHTAGLDINKGVDEIVSVVDDYTRNFNSYFDRFLIKEGYKKADNEVVQAKPTNKIKEVKPEVENFYEQIKVTGDKHSKALPGSQLLSYRSQWDANNGFTFYNTEPKNKQRDINKTYNNVEGVGHFILDASPLDGKTYMHANNFAFINAGIQSDNYIPMFEPIPNSDGQVIMKYKKPSEMTEEELKALSIFTEYAERAAKAKNKSEKDQIAKEYTEAINYNKVKIVAPLRQYNFDNVDFGSSVKAPNFKQAKYLKTKDGKLTNLLFTDPGKNKYGRFDGVTVSFIFKDAYGNNIVRDFSGTINDIQKEGNDIKTKYGLKDNELVIGYHDVGSFSAKPAAVNGKLSINFFDGYNNNSGTGSALIIPKQK